MTWYFPRLGLGGSARLGEWMYPIDKTNLDVLRCAFPGAGRGDGPLRSAHLAGAEIAWLRPAIVCGQHSLEIFCLGVFLAFAAHFVMGRILRWRGDAGVGQHLRYLIMVATASLISWYKRIEGRGRGNPSDRRMPRCGGEA